MAIDLARVPNKPRIRLFLFLDSLLFFDGPRREGRRACAPVNRKERHLEDYRARSEGLTKSFLDATTFVR